MTTNGKFGTLTIKNNNEQDVTQNCILNVGVNIIGSSVNANVRLYDTNVDQQHCIVEVKEDGLVTVAALHIFPQTKVNNLTLLKNRKVVLKNGDVLKIANTEITYNNDSSRTCNQAGITKQIKQKIFPFNTPRRRSCNPTSSSAKKAPASVRIGATNKQSLFSPAPLIVKKNLPPKHNDDWPSEPLDHDQFPFVGHFSPQKKERPLQDIPETMSGLEDVSLKPSSPSLVNIVAPTVRISTCTSTSDFDKKKNEETMVPDVKSEVSINSNDVSLNSFFKPSVCLSACLSGRKSSLPALNTNLQTSRRQSRSSSCVTPKKASLAIKSRLTCSEHKLSNESQPSFLQSEFIEMENSTISPKHENSEMNSSTPTSAVRSSNNLTLLGTPTSIIKKRDSMLNKSPSLNKMDKTNNMDNSEAREKSKSRLFDQSLEYVDGDSLAVSTDTSSFVYESALAVLPSVDDFEVEEIIEDFQVSVAPVSKDLNSSTSAPNGSDISGIASLASTPEPKNTISNYEMMVSHVDIGESTSNQTDLSYESTVSVHIDEDTLKDSQFEQDENYSSITISSNENLDISDAASLDSDLIDLREPSLEKLEDEMEEIRRDSKRRMSLDMEPQPEATNYSKTCNSMYRFTEILNIDEQKQETSKSNNTFQIQITEEEVISVNAEFQSSAVQIGTRSSARKSKMGQATHGETNSSSMQGIEDESGNGSSLILAMDQDDETTEESSITEKKVNETFTLTETSETLPTIVVQTEEIKSDEEIDNSEIEDDDESRVTEKIEILPERKSKRISLRQGTPVVSGNSSARKSKICQLPIIRVNDQTIEINDSDDTDASTASESKSKRNSKLLRTPVKNSSASSEVRSSRKSKIPQTGTIELNDSDDTDDASTTSDGKSKRNEKVFQTPIKNSPAVSVVRSTRKSSIQTPSMQEGSDCNTVVQMSEDVDASVVIQTPLIQGSLIAFGDRSTKKSKVFQMPLLREDEVFGFDDSEDTDSSDSPEPVAADVRSIRQSKIVQTPLLQDDNAVEFQDVLVVTDRKSKRISKVFQNSLILDSPLNSEVGLTRTSEGLQSSIAQNEEGSESSDFEDIVRSGFIENKTPSVQQTPVVAEVRSTRKSQIVQTPSLQGVEIVELEDISASGRKSRRISNVLKTPSVSGTPITSGVGSARKSKIFQTPLLEDEEVSKSEDAEEVDDSVLTKNKSRGTSALLQTPSMQLSPTVAGVRSTRKSKIVQTPSLSDNIVEPEDPLAATDWKSKRISKALQTPSISDLSDTSEVDLTTKSQVPETPILEDQAVDSSDSEDMDDSISTENNTRCASTILQASSIVCTPASQVESTRKSEVIQTPSLRGDEIVESENISASGRKSRRISNVLKTSVVSDTPIESTRKSKVFQTPLLENKQASESGESGDIDDSILIENAALQTPSRSYPAVANVRSTRKSKIVQTPTLPDDEIVEPEDTSAATARKSKRILKVFQTSSILDSPGISEVDSTTKTQVPETSKASDSSDSENMDNSVFTEDNSSFIQRTPAVVEVRSTRKSKIVQTPSLQDNEIVESEGISASGRKSRRISNVVKTPSISGTPITSGVGSTRKSRVFQTPKWENVEAFQSKDLEDVDSSILTENESIRTSTLLETPSIQRSPAVAEIRSTRKSKIVESQDTLAETERKSKRISKVLQTSEAESQSFETSVLQDEAYDSSGSEDMDYSVFTDNNSRRESTLSQAQPVQCTPTAAGRTTSLQSDEIVESESISASGRRSRRISNVLKTPSVSGTPITSGVVSARKSKIFQTPLLEDEEVSKSEDAEEVDDSVLTKNKSSRTSTLLQTQSPAVAKVRSTKKSKIVTTPSLQDDIESNTDEEADHLEDTSPIAANKSRTSKLPSTPLVQSSPVPSSTRSARKSKIINSSLLQNEEIADRKSLPSSPVFADDTKGSTNAVALDGSDVTANESSTFQEGSSRRSQALPESANVGVPTIETDRKSKRISKISSLQNTPTVSGVISTRKSKILPTSLSENKSTETETTTLLQTPSKHDLPSTSGVRSTRKSKVSKTPLLLNNKDNFETEEIDTPVNKSKLVLTPQNSPVVSGVRSTRKSKISVTPIVISTMKTRRGSKTPQTPMIQEEANTSTTLASKSKRTSKLLQTNSDNTPSTSGIQDLKTPSMQDLNQTNSGIKSKRISKLQQTPLIQEEANLSNVSGRKSATPKNIEKSKTLVSSAIKPQRISKAFETLSLTDFEEIESPLSSPVKSRNTSKVLTFNTPTDKDESESEVETSPAPKRRKVGGRTVNTEPRNDLTNVQGVKTMFKTPKVQKQPHNDLTDVKGVKKLMATPKVQNSPGNDLTNVGGVKKLLKTPRVPKEPRNDLTDVQGVKKLMATPKVQNSPTNDLTNVGGVKKLLKTPRVPKEPRNDLTDVQGVKKLMTKQKSPQNDLSDVRGVKQLVVTPKPRKSANLSGLGDFFATTSKTTTPKHGLSEVRGVKKILDIKKSKKSLKVQNSPKNDLTNVVGVKKMFAEEEAQYNRDFNVSGVAEIMNKSDELFNSLLDKKPPKTYGRKSTPLKLDASVNVAVVSGTPVMSEEVVNWVNTQDFNKGEVVENLTPIKSKKNENLSISKKQNVAIHSSTPLNKGNRGILKEIEANIHQDIESSEATNDKNLKKVQFLDDSNLRKSKRTPRMPSKISTEFVINSPKSLKRKADEDENVSSAKIPKMASESNNASVIIIDSETEGAVTRKVLPIKGAKKAPKSQSKKAKHSDKVEEESVDNNQEDEQVEVSKPTRGRAIRETNKKGVEVENKEEINASSDEKIENGKIEVPKTTRGRLAKKNNAKTSKKVEKLQIENTEEIKTNEKVEEIFDQNEEIEIPKTKRGRALQKTNTKTVKQMEKVEGDKNSDNEEVEEANEEVEVPKTKRRRPLKTTNAKTTKKVEKVENSTNDEEEIEMPETTRGRATKKTSAKNLKENSTEEKNESLKKITRSRKMEKVSEPEKQLDSSVEVLSDKEKDEPVIAVPKKRRERPTSKTVEEVPENNDDKEIETPEITRGRAVKKTSAKTSKKSMEENLKANLTEEKNESLKKSTRSRKVTKKPEPEKQFDSSLEILSDEEKDESVFEVPKKTRGQPASKTIKKVPENNGDEEIEAPKTTRGRAAKKTNAKTSKKSMEEQNESLKKTTRLRKVAKKPEPEKQFDSSIEILSDEEKDEPTIEVQKTTRGRAASKTNKKVSEKSTRLRAAPKGKKVAEVETSINSTLESSKARVEETSLSKTKRTRGIKRTLEVEIIEEQENSITANPKKNIKRSKVENDSQLEKELEVSKTSRRRPVVTKTRVLKSNKNSIENSEMDESKNEETNKAVRGRKTKAEVQLESKSEEEVSKGATTRGKRKLYSLDDSVKIDVEEVVKAEVKRVVRTRNVKEKADVVAPVRSSKRTRK